MVKSPIKVFVRVRPDATCPSEDLHFDNNGKCINLTIPLDDTRGHLNPQPEYWNFKFDKVFMNTSQEEIFKIVAKDTIKSALEGYSGTIFCYGQTGAGKTFTMSGSSSSYKHRGVIPRTISALFNEIKKRPDEQINVSLSYLEIHNENLLDLLNNEQDSLIAINEDKKGSIVLKGLSQIECFNEQEGLDVLFKGEMNKTMSQHNLNKISSRAHSIFTLYIQNKTQVEGDSNQVTYSKINLVDLAGSERVKKTGSEGQTLIEANYINKSLSFLEQVVVALSEKQRDHVPYRQSKLTNLLKDSIGGNCKTTMIANIWSEFSNLEETISTLKFASRMKKVSNEATANIQVGYASPHKNFEKEFSINTTFREETYRLLTAEEKHIQYKLAKKYLNRDLEDIEIKSFSQAKEFIKQCRNIYQDLFGAAEEFLHLIPFEKRREIGLRGIEKVKEFQNSNKLKKESIRRLAKQEVRAVQEFENDQETSFEHEKQSEDERTIIKGVTGLIRQRSQQRSRAQYNTSRSSIQPMQEVEYDEYESELDLDGQMNCSRDGSTTRAKSRLRDQEEKLNELKANIVSTGQNIKKSKTLLAEKKERSILNEALHQGKSFLNEASFRVNSRNNSTRNEFERDRYESSSDYQNSRRPGYVYKN